MGSGGVGLRVCLCRRVFHYQQDLARAAFLCVVAAYPHLKVEQTLHNYEKHHLYTHDNTHPLASV